MALKRSLGLAALVFYGVGSIVGAGIYSVLGVAAADAGRSVWVSFVSASLVAGLTALSYAELASMSTRAGAEYQYLKLAFPRWRALALIAGVLIALNASATSATVALAFGGYLGSFFAWPAAISAFVLLAACTGLNIAGIRQATWATVVLVCIELGGLLLLTGAGFAAGTPGEALALPRVGDAGAIFAATALVFFVYIGFEDIVNLAEESRQPRRDLPRALLLSVAITSLVYFLVVWAALALATPESLGASASPLRTAAARAAPWIGQAVASAALVATASTALITLVSISRLLYGMARDGALPRVLARELPRRKTPWVAALVLFGAATALLPLGEIRQTASVSALGLLLVFSAIHLAVIALRRRAPERERGFRVPGAIGGVPLLPLLGALGCLALSTRFETVAYLVVGGVLLLAALGYFILRTRRTSAS